MKSKLFLAGICSIALMFGLCFTAFGQTAEDYFNRGMAYYEQDNYDQAIEAFTQAITLDPNDADAYFYRGIAYGAKEDNDRAIADFTQAIRLDPNLAFAYYNRGNAYYDKGDNDRAIQDLEKAISINPNYERAKTLLKEIRGY